MTAGIVQWRFTVAALNEEKVIDEVVTKGEEAFDLTSPEMTIWPAEFNVCTVHTTSWNWSRSLHVELDRRDDRARRQGGPAVDRREARAVGVVDAELSSARTSSGRSAASSAARGSVGPGGARCLDCAA